MTEAELVERYAGFAYTLADAAYLVGGDRDDVRQEALLGLLNAARDYDPSHGTTFRTFAALCIKRQLWTAMKTARRTKHHVLSSALREVVLEEEIVSAVDAIADPLAEPHRALEARETLDRFWGTLPALSPMEARAIVGFAVGATYRELNDRPEFNKAAVSHVDNAYVRARQKLAA